MQKSIESAFNSLRTVNRDAQDFEMMQRFLREVESLRRDGVTGMVGEGDLKQQLEKMSPEVRKEMDRQIRLKMHKFFDQDWQETEQPK